MDYNAGHPTTTPIDDDIVLPDTILFTNPFDNDGTTTLTADEIGYFKTQGFLVKRDLVEDDLAFEQITDHVWENVPRGLMRRDDPATWELSSPEEWTPEDHERVGLLSRGNWKMRSRGEYGIGTEPFLVDRVANNANILAVVEAFIGAPVRPPRRVRGVYCIFPKPRDVEGRYGPHSDYMAAHLSAMVMVANIPPNAGGFTVWPGSHKRLHLLWDTVHGGTMSQDNGERYREERDAILREVSPVEFSGKAGDVIFWHPRLLHSAGINNSASWDAPLVRMIVPCDYQRDGLTFYDDNDYGPGPSYQWWVDTRNYREDIPPTEDNLWDDWAV